MKLKEQKIKFSINQNHQESVSWLDNGTDSYKFSINQNHQESVSSNRHHSLLFRLALIKITKSPYRSDTNGSNE